MKPIMKAKPEKSKNNTAKNSDSRYELCIMCNKLTPILKEQPIEYRSFYILGCGQLCYECHHKIYPESRKSDELPSDWCY